MSIVRVTAYPLALNTYSAAMQLKRLARFGQGALYNIAWSPDGKYLAIATGLGVYLYDAVTFELERLIDVNDHVIDFAFSPDGRSLAITRDNRIETWDVASGQKIIDLEGEIEGGVWEVVNGPGGYIAAFGQKYRGAGENIPQLKVWRASNGRLLYADDRMLYWTTALDVSPDGKMIAYLDREGIGIHDIQTGEILQSAPGDYDAAFSPDGTRLFTSGYREYGDKGFPIWMYTLENGEKIQILTGTKCQYLSRNGSALIGYGLNEIVIIDPATGLALKTISMPSEIEDAAINPDGHYLAVIEGYTVVVMETQTEQVLKTFDFDYFATLAVGLARLDDADYYAAALSNDSGQVQVLDLAGGSILRQFQASEALICDLAFSPDRLTLASIDKNGMARLWNLPDLRITQEYDLSAQGADGELGFSPDGLKLTIRDWNQPNVYELNLQSGELRQIEKSPQAVRMSSSIAYRWVDQEGESHPVTWEQTENEILFRDITSDETITLTHAYIGDDTIVEEVALSPDGNYFATGMMGADILIWDLRSREIIQTLRGHEWRGGDGGISGIRYLAFNPQNDLLASVGHDGTTRLWNIHSGLQLQKLNTCCFAGFSPDGRILVTAGQGVIRVWGIPPWP